MAVRDEAQLKRATCSFRAQNSKFIAECEFAKQYNKYYRIRFERTRPMLKENCKLKWGSRYPILNLNQLGTSLDSECIILGTLAKRMRLQPDVVDELSKGDFHVKCERYSGHYASPDDTLVLEDPDESILLEGSLDPKEFVTGVIVGLFGMPVGKGDKFCVKDICFAQPSREFLYDDNMLMPSSKSKPSEPIYLMLVSGLGFAPGMKSNEQHIRALQNMIDFVWGGGKYENEKSSSRVARILVAGDSLSNSRLVDGDEVDPAMDGITDEENTASRMKQSRQIKPYSGSVEAVRHLDEFFAQLSKTIDVDVMPGTTDPSSHLMPQQPFHPCMFPKSCMYSTFNCATNPFHATYNDDVEILVTSGQNIDIISKFSCLTDPIEIMKCHLRWGNCAPSAPDNLYSVPYEEEDPFVIDFIPEIYVAGCQDFYHTAYYNYELNSKGDLESRKRRTLLITVPKFCETFGCVLVDLTSLETREVSFK